MPSTRGFALASLLCASCTVGEVSDDRASLAAKNRVYDRVVLGRMYQKLAWTLPQAGTTDAERIAYVCDRLVELDPTYVSGLLRIDDDTVLRPSQIAIFRGVVDCVHAIDPRVSFDVVLNAEHYADDAVYAKGADALVALKNRAREIKNVLGADIVFFDFFNSPYNDSRKHEGWHADALTRGTAWIRDELHLKVGGNVWGFAIPPNSDFVALDNFARDDGRTPGLEFIKQQLAAFNGKKPVLVHIENNPQKHDSEGLAWIDGSETSRREELAKYAGLQKQKGFSYMAPLFFPLQCCITDTSGTRCGPDKCEMQGSQRVSYDASLDGEMMTKLDDALGK